MPYLMIQSNIDKKSRYLNRKFEEAFDEAYIETREKSRSLGETCPHKSVEKLHSVGQYANTLIHKICQMYDLNYDEEYNKFVNNIKE